MTLAEILLIAVGLAMDAFAVSLGAATCGRISGRRAAFRLAFHFGVFQALMPLAGWALGATVAPFIEGFDHWVAFGLLAFVGGRMVRSGLSPETETADCQDPSRGWTLVILSVATSIDALAVGLSFAMLHISAWLPAAIIGGVTRGMCLIGIYLGGRLGEWVGKRMEVVGGLVLLLIGLRILLAHLLGWG
jgi:putative Mn2+ efflux pump MntP